ncbi:MAG: response regulator [Pseudomonadota bacterium]|nr:response regulator [Pseudomonadota bacterium]
MIRILIAEDELKIARLIADYLKASGYETQMVHHGDEVLTEVERFSPNIVLLDWMMPGQDGLTICRQLGEASSCGIIMLTAKTEEVDRLLGLGAGADDYICKPFSPKEVVARVDALARRLQKNAMREDVSAGLNDPTTVDEQRQKIRLNGVMLDLTPTEFRLLAAMIKKPGHIFSRDTLLDIAYADFRDNNDRAIDSHMKNLRRKLKQQEATVDCIKSVYGVGYKIEL